MADFSALTATLLQLWQANSQIHDILVININVVKSGKIRWYVFHVMDQWRFHWTLAPTWLSLASAFSKRDSIISVKFNSKNYIRDVNIETIIPKMPAPIEQDHSAVKLTVFEGLRDSGTSCSAQWQPEVSLVRLRTASDNIAGGNQKAGSTSERLV